MFLDLLNTFFATIIAIIVAIVAALQWRTNHNRLVLELFEKRAQVLADIESASNLVMRDGSVLKNSALQDLHRATAAARFLFGQEVLDRLEVLRKHFLALYAARSDYGDNETPERKRARQRAGSDAVEFTAAFYDELRQLIAPYMKMDHKVR